MRNAAVLVGKNGNLTWSDGVSSTTGSKVNYDSSWGQSNLKLCKLTSTVVGVLQ